MAPRTLEALFEKSRIIPSVSDVVRARSLARARATSAAVSAPTPAEASPARMRRLPVAIAASVAFVLGAAGTAGALLGRGAVRPPDASPPPSERAVPRARVSIADDRAPALGLEPRPPAKPRHTKPRAAAPESYADELELLQRARARHAARDFQDALILLAEHTRRFPNGRLAEEREALRVRSLALSGRLEEARVAGKAFAGRFPRSVLLPRLLDPVGAAP
jgi:hypothetical protein